MQCDKWRLNRRICLNFSRAAQTMAMVIFFLSKLLVSLWLDNIIIFLLLHIQLKRERERKSQPNIFNISFGRAAWKESKLNKNDVQNRFSLFIYYDEIRIYVGWGRDCCVYHLQVYSHLTQAIFVLLKLKWSMSKRRRIRKNRVDAFFYLTTTALSGCVLPFNFGFMICGFNVFPL